MARNASIFLDREREREPRNASLYETHGSMGKFSFARQVHKTSLFSI